MMSILCFRVLLSKANINNEQVPLYTITASATHVALNYSSEWEVYFNVSLPSQYWHHVAVTVYKEDVALYINGTIQEALGAPSTIMSNISTDLYVGQTPHGMGECMHFMLLNITDRNAWLYWVDGRYLLLYSSSDTKVQIESF